MQSQMCTAMHSRRLWRLSICQRRMKTYTASARTSKCELGPSHMTHMAHTPLPWLQGDDCAMTSCMRTGQKHCMASNVPAVGFAIGAYRSFGAQVAHHMQCKKSPTWQTHLLLLLLLSLVLVLLLLLLVSLKWGLPRPWGGFLMHLGCTGPQGPVVCTMVCALVVAVAGGVHALGVCDPLTKGPCPTAVGSSPS